MLHFTGFVLARQKAGPEVGSQKIGSRPENNMAGMSKLEIAAGSCLDCRAA